MKIYHGTHTGALQDILASGLKPRGQGKGNWPDAPSHDEYVYLTNAYPLYFAVASVPDKSDAFPVVLEIDLDCLQESRLCPDEDFVAQALWKEKMRGETIKDPALRRARSFAGLAKRIQPLAYQAVWRTSLEYLGQVAYWGSIPADAISRYAFCLCFQDGEDECGVPVDANHRRDGILELNQNRQAAEHHRGSR